MHMIREKKKIKRLCKWMASLMMIILLINQSGLVVLAEEIREPVCCCDTRCRADSVNESCPVCAKDYGKCEREENTADSDANKKAEESDTDEDVTTESDANTTPDVSADDEANIPATDENTDADTDIAPDAPTNDEAETPDADEDVNADADTVINGKDEPTIFLQYDEEENILEEESATPVSEEDTFSDGKFTYTIISEDGNDLQVEVSGHVDGTAVSGALEIPSTASDGTNEYPVVRIGHFAFKDCTNLTSVTIPDSVTSIGGSVFYNCSNLTSVIIPDSVNDIGGSAFYYCSNLENINIPAGITTIKHATFRYCRSLKSAAIPDGVTTIGKSAFELCDSLANVTIANSVTVIEGSAFSMCKSLDNVTIPGNVTSLGNASFGFCPNLTSVTILNDHISIGDGSFIESKLSSFRIAISENITTTPTLGNLCFYNVPLGDDTPLTFLTKDGTMKLSNTTTPTLAEAIETYNAVDDGGINDGYWYGWRLPEIPPVTGHPISITVNKDGSTWSDSEKEFALSPDNGVTFITDLTDISNGTYIIYDITGAADSAGYVNTGVTIEVNDTATDAEINYYTVTFYNGDTVFNEQIVLNNTKISAPSASPTKDGYTFHRWSASADGSMEFNFENPITAKTDIYASWITNEEKTFTITASAGTGGSVAPSGEVKVKSGDNQEFAITPEDNYQITSILVDGNKVLNDIQALSGSKSGSTASETNTKYYVFENVDASHTLAAYFEAIQPDDSNAPDHSGDDDTGGNGGDDDSTDGTPNDSSGSDGSSGNADNGTSSSDSSGGNLSVINSDTTVISTADIVGNGETAPASKDREPKTGYASYMEIYATIAMISGLTYLLLYFADGKNGMTEAEKKEIVTALVKWAKKGKRLRKYVALAMIFLILVYYHSIGKRTSADWKEVYEK